MDALKNFAYSLVVTAPSPATSGTSLVVTAGQGALFPATPFDLTMWPAGVRATFANAEIARCTAVSTDTLTITRAQYGTTAQSVAVGWQVEQGVTANLLGQLLALSGGTMTGALTLSGAPTTSLMAATKAYVDATAQGLSIKDSVNEATATALPTNTYAAGVITITATGVLTVDGVTVALNDRVLVKNEVTGANNGIYLCTTAGAVGVAAVLTRATDSNTSAEIVGAFCFVETGTVNAGAGFVNTNSGTITIGTTAITYTQFSGAGEITAGTGLSKTGNTLAVDSTVVAELTATQTLTNKTLTAPVISSIANTGTLTLPTSTDTLVGRATTDTLTNKRVTKRVYAYSAPGATPTINTDNYDVVNMTGLATAITSMTTNLSGTPTSFQSLILGFTDNGTAQAITWGTSFEASTVALPTTTVVSALLLVGFFWNPTTSKWRCVASA